MSECECEIPAIDETGTCFECGGTEPERFLPDWLKYLADTCPEEDSKQFINKVVMRDKLRPC